MSARHDDPRASMLATLALGFIVCCGLLAVLFWHLILAISGQLAGVY